MKTTNLIGDEDKSDLSGSEQFAMDLLMGLCMKPKSIPSKYFYDDKGSQLFQQITREPDYYLTNAELDILKSAKTEIPKALGQDQIDVVELGVGDGHKSKVVINGLLNTGAKVNFFPIDISAEALALLQDNFSEKENLSIHGVVAEYIEGLRFVRTESNNKLLVLFLGSNIGNFDKHSVQRFLRMLWNSMGRGDYLLTGFDLKKDLKVLDKAYNDSGGTTEKFNLNLLERINNELGGDFDLKCFQHYGTYNPILGAMESYLVSTKKQTVYIKELERKFEFKAYEPIHLEYSFKFNEDDIDYLSRETGFSISSNFSDEKKLFMSSLWRVEKS